MLKKEVIIVGAGVSGLTAAYSLQKAGISPLLIEARERWGGRVLTVSAPGNATPVEMGATWFTDKHHHLHRLLQELGLAVFTQYQKGVGIMENSPTEAARLFQLPPTIEPSYRIVGGTASLTNALAARLESEQLLLGSTLTHVAAKENNLVVSTDAGEHYTCHYLIITVPPHLIRAQQIDFDPELPSDVLRVMETTHTWMGEAIKFAVEYSQPFWRKKGYAGVIFSQAGLAQEIHDHSNAEETRSALKGFLREEALRLRPDNREAAVILQLSRLLGTEAGHYLSYTEKLWKEDAYTYAAYDNYVLPHQHNGHPLYAKPLLNGRLMLAGTETSPHYGGYLEGAVYSGLAAARAILEKIADPVA